MSLVVSMRFKESQMNRLRRLARRLGRTPSEAGALLIEESLRQMEFGHIVFRDSPAGRQAYLQGSGLAVWEVMEVARHYGMDAKKTGRHLQWPADRVSAALNYAEAFPEEIEMARQDNAAYGQEVVVRMLPQTTVFSISEAEDRMESAPRRRKKTSQTARKGGSTGRQR